MHSKESFDLIHDSTWREYSRAVKSLESEYNGQDEKLFESLRKTLDTPLKETEAEMKKNLKDFFAAELRGKNLFPQHQKLLSEFYTAHNIKTENQN